MYRRIVRNVLTQVLDCVEKADWAGIDCLLQGVNPDDISTEEALAWLAITSIFRQSLPSRPTLYWRVREHLLKSNSAEGASRLLVGLEP